MGGRRDGRKVVRRGENPSLAWAVELWHEPMQRGRSMLSTGRSAIENRLANATASKLQSRIGGVRAAMGTFCVRSGWRNESVAH